MSRLLAYEQTDDSVIVRDAGDKGLGLFAATDLPPAVYVAAYVTRGASTHPFNAAYTIKSPGRPHACLSLCRESFGPPVVLEHLSAVGPLPRSGAFANEPDEAQGFDAHNCELKSLGWRSDGRVHEHALRTLRAIRAGEELTWDYGASYSCRTYASKYDKK